MSGLREDALDFVLAGHEAKLTANLSRLLWRFWI